MESLDWPTIGIIAAVIAANVANWLASYHARDGDGRESLRRKGFWAPLSQYQPTGLLYKTLAFAFLGVALLILYAHFLAGATSSLPPRLWPIIGVAGILGLAGSVLAHFGLRYIPDAETRRRFRTRTLFAPLSAFAPEGRKFQVVSRLLIGLAMGVMIVGVFVGIG